MTTNRNVRYARYERKLHGVRKTKHKRQLLLHGMVMMLIMVIGLRMCLVQAMDKKQEQEVVNNNVSTTSKVVQTTYFENCTDEDNWHSRNLEYLYESEGIRFYK